jgi:hypothetical protein
MNTKTHQKPKYHYEKTQKLIKIGWIFTYPKDICSGNNCTENLDFYLPHMEYEGSIGFVSRKNKKKYY